MTKKELEQHFNLKIDNLNAHLCRLDKYVNILLNGNEQKFKETKRLKLVILELMRTNTSHSKRTLKQFESFADEIEKTESKEGMVQ